jgi:excisionase family DNA binding protein
MHLHHAPAIDAAMSSPSSTTPLLTATDVQALFGVDRSTVYRMAEDGRLPAVKVGKQWRFQRAAIEDVLTARPRKSADQSGSLQLAANVAGELLGVMVMVTDMDGQPLTRPANPCERFASADDEALAACAAEWKDFAGEADVTPRFRMGPLGFECARAFVRSGNELVAMVLVGGIAAPGDISSDLHILDVRHRADVLAKLPRIAAALTPMRTPTAVNASTQRSAR